MGFAVALAVSIRGESLTAEQEQLVEQNLPLVQHIVGRMTQRFPATYSRDDLVQAGAVGLIEAVTRFDPDRGFSFSTFAGRRIEGAVLDALRNADWASRSVRQNERQLRSATATLTAGLGREPTEREISTSMRVGLDELRGLKTDLARARLDTLHRQPSPQRTGAGGGELDVPAVDDDLEQLERRELLGYLRDAIDLLPERHRLVIVGYFLEGRSMTDLGHLLGVTQSRASQLKGEALAMMNDGLRAAMEAPADQERSGATGQAAYNQALRAASTWRQRLGPSV